MSGSVVGSVAVTVVPEIRQFNSTVKAELTGQADELGHDAGKHLREAINAELHDVRLTPDVNDEAAIAKIEALKGEIDELKLKVDELSHKRANIDVRVNNASGVRSWMTSLIAGAVAIAPAFVVAAGGVAAFAALAVPSLKNVLKYEHDLSHNTQKAAQDWAGLTASQRQMALSITGLKTEFGGFAREVQPQVLDVFNAALHQTAQFLPQLVPLAQAGSKALVTLITDIGQTFNGPAGQEFFKFIEQNIGKDMSAIGQTVDALIKTFFSLTEALQPVSLGLLSVVGGAADLISALSHLNPLIDDAIVLTIALYKPFKVLEGLSLAATFTRFGKALTGVAAASDAKGLKFAWIAGTVSSMKGAVTAAEALKTAEFEAAAGQAAFAVSSEGTVIALGAEDVALGALTASETAAAAGMAALEAVSPVGWAIAAGTAVAALGYVLLQDTPTVNAYTDALAKQDDAANANVAGYQKLASQTSDTAAATGKLRDAITSTAPAYESVRIGAAAYSVATAHVHDVNVQATQAATNLSGSLSLMQQAFGLTRSQAEKIAEQIPGVAKGFREGGAAAQQAQAKFAAYVAAGHAAVSATSLLSAEADVLSSSMSTAAQKANELGAAFKALVSPTLDLADASVQAKQDQVTLASALAKSHDQLGTATQAQRTATTATTAAARSAEAYSQELLANGASAGRAAGPMRQLVQELEQAGVKGGAAARIIAELRQQIAALHGKQIRIEIDEAVVSSGGGAAPVGAPGIRASAGGAVIPGYAPGVDSVGPIWASPGESIMVPEFTRALGPDNVMALNHALSGGRKSTGFGYAGGGITPDGLGGAPLRTFGDKIDIYLHMLETGPGYAAKSLTGHDAAIRLAKEFSDGALKTVAQIKTAEREAIKEISEYYTGPNKRLLIGAIKEQTGQMEHLAAESKNIADRIKAERQYAAQETQSLQGFSNISSITGATDPVTGIVAPVTGGDIKTGVAAMLATLRKFETVIKELKKAKVSRVLIAQVIALGPADGITYGEAILAGGASLIRTLNREETEISNVERGIGDTAAEIHSGQSISKGFLSGLKKDRSELDREMKRLGEEIARELRDALHKPPKKGHGHSTAALALSPGTLSTAQTIGGTTGASGLSRSDASAIRSSLRAIEARELAAMTREQGHRIIGLLENIDKTAPKRTGTATAAALDSVVKGGTLRARANVG